MGAALNNCMLTEKQQYQTIASIDHDVCGTISFFRITRRFLGIACFRSNFLKPPLMKAASATMNNCVSRFHTMHNPQQGWSSESFQVTTQSDIRGRSTGHFRTSQRWLLRSCGHSSVVMLHSLPRCGFRFPTENGVTWVKPHSWLAMFGNMRITVT